tara:strand:+ start:1443 stop:1670 length:228 start_codon:yes stop_codon:yes gene_type:complete
MINKLKKLVDKLENSIDKNSCELWMPDLSSTIEATCTEAVNYKSEDKTKKYNGFYKDFLILKKEIYKLNNKEQLK